MIGAPSIFKVIRKATVLTRVLPTFAFRVTENAAWWKWNSPESEGWRGGMEGGDVQMKEGEKARS